MGNKLKRIFELKRLNPRKLKARQAHLEILNKKLSRWIELKDKYADRDKDIVSVIDEQITNCNTHINNINVLLSAYEDLRKKLGK